MSDIEVILNCESQNLDVGVQSGGLPAVNHDSTLKGTGTEVNPLGVADSVLQNIESKVTKTTEANKVYGTNSQGQQEIYDLDSFGKVDDVKVNGTSVVTNKIANVTVPTKTSDLTNDSGYITKDVDDLTNYTKTSDLPVVGDGTLTIQKNGVTVGSFTANQTGNTTVNIEADVQRQADWNEADTTAPDYIKNKPTQVSDFTNDADYQSGTQVANSIAAHNIDSEAHEDIRGLISDLSEWTTTTIVPTTINFVPTTTYHIDEAFQRTANLVGGLQGEIDDINALIPNQATTQNQLADKDFVNSTVATNSANFRGNWATWADVPTTANGYPEDYTGSRTPTNNDYMVVDDASGYNAQNTGAWRFIFVGDWNVGGKANWQPAYRIGTAFTAAQQAAINSGITSTMVDDYVNPSSNANTAYNKRITALETDKLDKVYTANKIYGTDSTGAQQAYVAGDNLELSNGVINVVGVQQQIFVMPEATADKSGQIVQYMGETNATYTHGVMYQCVPVYGNYTATYSGTGTVTNVQLNVNTFINSAEYREGQTSYVFTCISGMRQQWESPSGRRTTRLTEYGITYSGRAAVTDTITVTSSVVGYTWEAYAGVSSGNDKIQISGDKIYGVNVVPQYSRTTLPTPTANNAGMICQYKGSGTLLDMYRDGYFYQVTEDVRLRDFSLEADPNKYSSLDISDWTTLYDFMEGRRDDVTFRWEKNMLGTGWYDTGSLGSNPESDLSRYGISYTLADGQTLSNGDEITIHILKSYYWKHIQVQANDFIVDVLPDADMDNWGRVVFLTGSNMITPSPEYPAGKWYRCEEVYDAEDDEYYYDWVLLPNQISLPMVTEMETDASKVITGQCFNYAGDDSVEYSNDLQRIVLRKGHIYRAVIKYPDDEDFATVCYYDAYPYQFDAMPTGEEEYNEVVAQYTGTDESTYAQGHFYRCVPTGEMTAPSSMSRPSEEGFSFEIDAEVLETQVQDPTQTFTFEFESQGPGNQWLVKTGSYWIPCELSDYGITVVGEAPYGAQVKVKYIEPQPEYIWQEVPVGDTIQYEEMPEVGEHDVGRIVQYIGETTDSFVNGYFYQAVTEIVPSRLNYYASSLAFTVALDKDQFESYVEPTGDMDLVFIYNAGDSTWLLQGGDLPVAVDIADYGVTITGTPNNNDRLELFYYYEYPDYWWEEKDVQNNSQTKYMNDVEPLDVGKIRQYTGVTDQDYTNGYFYKAHIGLDQTSGSETNPLSVIDEESFASTVYATEESSSAEVKSISFEVATGLNTQWVLCFLDENGNEIGRTTTNPELSDFEQIFGLSIGGTVTTSTTAEANITFDWERVDVQPAGGATVVYDPTNESLTIS